MRTCPNCGHMLSDKDTICFKCGLQLSQIQQPSMTPPPPMQQPMMNPNMGPNMNPQQQKPTKPKLIQKVNPSDNDGKSIYIVAGIIVILVAIVGVIIFVGNNSRAEVEPAQEEEQVVLKPDEEEKKEAQDPDPIEPEDPSTTTDPTTPTEPEEPKQTQPTTPDTNSGSVQLGENEHLVKNNGYSYAVPNEYIEKDYGVKGFDLLDYRKTKEMIISVNIGTVAKLKNSLPALRQMYIDAGATISDVQVKTISGVEVVCVELTKNNQNLIMGITDAASGEIYVIAAYNVKSNNFDYGILTEGINIVKTAVKTASGSVET